MKAILFPGQGAQYRGMGENLFGAFKEYTGLASELLGYSIEELCLNDPEQKLGQTQYTQPALYVVNALNYYHGLRQGNSQADYFMGHSLGEYNALLAAGAFDFVTGLKLVKKRGELMGAVSGGRMAAVLGLKSAQVEKILSSEAGGLNNIDLANYNTPTQVVISGPVEAIDNAVKILERENARCIHLNVSAAFHSRYMKDSQTEFEAFIESFSFGRLEIPVIANSTARPYEPACIAQTLCEQIASPVLWVDSVRYLMGRKVTDYMEIGSTILTRMVNEIVKREQPLFPDENSLVPRRDSEPENREMVYPLEKTRMGASRDNSNSSFGGTGKIEGWMLGSKDFCREYGVRLAYVAGAMYEGIASKELVTRMGQAGLMSYFGTAGLTLEQIEDAIRHIQKRLTHNQPYGLNLLYRPEDAAREADTVALYLKYGIRFVEAAAYLQMTVPLVLYRLKGLRRNESGEIVCENRVLAKVSRPEVAEAFMSPAPEWIVKKLLQSGRITAEQAQMSREIPVSHDICAQADGGWFTEGGVPVVLMPAVIALRDRMMKKHAYKKSIRIGLAGGIGTPEAAASAFVMGADFILTGSINQCTVEAGISDSVKDMLQGIDVHDTDYAPTGDMLESGAKVQVLKRGVLFPVRARKLHFLYSQYPSLAALPQETLALLEDKYFKQPLDRVWRETESYLAGKGRAEDIERANSDPKYKMALVFGRYFHYSSRLALEGDQENRLDYQVHTGSALGAFNQWTKGAELENWRSRHVNEIAEKLMAETAAVLNGRYSRFFSEPGSEAKVREPAAV